MADLEKVLYNLVVPMVDNKDSLSVKTMPSLNENEILLYVYADSEDVARLIGKGGSMASSLRQVMSIASKLENKRVIIKFEAY